MNQQRFAWILVAAACVLHAGFVTPVAAQETEALVDDHVAGDFGRLLYQENGVTVRRAAADAEPSLERVAGLNAPVFPVPVCAEALMSKPFSIFGITFN